MDATPSTTDPTPTSTKLDALRAKHAELREVHAGAAAEAEALLAAEKAARVATLTDPTAASQTAWAKARRAYETAVERHAEAARDLELVAGAIVQTEQEVERARRARFVAENERRRAARAAAGPALHAELARLAPVVQRFTACALAAAAVHGADVQDIPLLMAEWLGGTRHHTGLSGENPAIAQVRAQAGALIARLENGEALS